MGITLGGFSLHRVRGLTYLPSISRFSIWPAQQITRPRIGPRVQAKWQHVFSSDNLAGALNWEVKKKGSQTAQYATTAVCTSPLILPPTFNKLDSNSTQSVWARALEVIQGAKRLIIVGYSMPKTVIYFQYFLRTALGRARDLDRIVVFDPVLFTKTKEGEEMQERYEACLSEPFRKRIEFCPELLKSRLAGSRQDDLSAATCKMAAERVRY